MPSLPKRKSNSDKSDPPTRPFARMALNAMSAGLSWRDLRHVKYTHLMQLLYEYEDANGADVTEYVDATGADVKALTKL